MQKVSLRDFQLKPSKYLEELPIALTRYGTVIAIVKSPQGEMNQEDIEKDFVETCKHGYPAHLCTKCKQNANTINDLSFRSLSRNAICNEK